jgi:hypothetical protein
MTTALAIRKTEPGALSLPNIVSREGQKTAERFVEFFTTNIRNKNTRLSYARAVGRYLERCERRGAGLTTIKPVLVAAYIEELPPFKRWDEPL